MPSGRPSHSMELEGGTPLSVFFGVLQPVAFGLHVVIVFVGRPYLAFCPLLGIMVRGC